MVIIEGKIDTIMRYKEYIFSGIGDATVKVNEDDVKESLNCLGYEV